MDAFSFRSSSSSASDNGEHGEPSNSFDMASCETSADAAIMAACLLSVGTIAKFSGPRAAVIGAAAAGRAAVNSKADRVRCNEDVASSPSAEAAPVKAPWTLVDDTAAGVTLMLAAGAELAEAGMGHFW